VRLELRSLADIEKASMGVVGGYKYGGWIGISMAGMGVGLLYGRRRMGDWQAGCLKSGYCFRVFDFPLFCTG
jgi:hypothetical protein